MKSAPIQTAFNGGELSPLVAGRVDVAKYGNGCKRMENFLPTVQGPAIARPGTIFVAEVKDSTDRTWLVRFEFNIEESYILEFGDEYIRFYTNRAQLLSGGPAYEIVSPYAVADLTNSDGTFALRYSQTGDTVYLAHSSYPPQVLSRFAPANWTIAPVAFDPPPFKEINDTSTTIYASAATGSVTLQASADIFTAAMVGEYVYLAEKDVRDVPLWEPGVSITAGDIRRSDDKNYEALNSDLTGSIKPTHTRGAEYDGDGKVQWEYMDPGYGWAQITAYTDANTVTATVLSNLPDGAVLVGNASTRWALQAWNETDGYPGVVTFFRERLTYARDSTVWFSVSGDFLNFSIEIDGEITEDAGFERTLASDRVNSIRWLSPSDVLLVGTLGDEWAISKSTTTDPFGPNNCEAKRQSVYGSNRTAPLHAGNDTLFVQKAARKVRAMAFRYEEDGFESPDITAFSEHVTRSGIVDMAFQQEPWSIVWACRTDGVLIGCTFTREQDVVAWHRHPFSGGVVECVECIPAPDGSRDDLWMIVRYTIDGTTKRYVCYLAAEDNEDTEQADWIYSDMAATYDGAPVTTISGLDYLEGQEVWVLTDGARHPNRTVSGGAITLQLSSSKVQVGLPCEGFVESMNLEAGSANGTSQGKTKRAHFATVRVHRSCGGVAGPTDATLKEMRYRNTTVPMGSPQEPYTGDVEIEWDGDYSTQQTCIVKKDRPMPLTVVAVMPQVWTSEGR
jgi:hypothetical protein